MGEIIQKNEWKTRLEQALSKAKNPVTANFLQLATVDQRGAPQVRTLVFRGITAGGEKILMATDALGAKLEQAEHNNRAQIVWYFVDAREQFRLSGTLEWDSGVAGDGDPENERLLLWRSLSIGTRSSFFADAMGVVAAESHDQINSHIPPRRFVLLALRVTGVDHLDLSGDPHKRVWYRRNEGETEWLSEQVSLTQD